MLTDSPMSFSPSTRTSFTGRAAMRMASMSSSYCPSKKVEFRRKAWRWGARRKTRGSFMGPHSGSSIASWTYV